MFDDISIPFPIGDPAAEWIKVDDIKWKVNLTGVNQVQKTQLLRILREMRPWVATTVMEIRHRHMMKHRIVLKEGAKSQISTRKVRLSYSEREWVVKHLATLEDANLIIRVREAKWLSDIRLAEKFESKDPFRLCINFVYLNSQSEKGVGQLRRLDEVLQALAGRRV